MNFKSACDGRLIGTLRNWLARQAEVLLLNRYSRSAGDQSLEFYSSFEAAHERLRQLPAETSVAAFRDFHLQLRGMVDDDFVERAIRLIPDGSEFAAVETVPTRSGRVY